MPRYLVEFYGISTFVGYLMLNPVYTKILNIWLENKSFLGNNFKMSQSLFVCTQLNGFKYRKWLNNSIWPIGHNT